MCKSSYPSHCPHCRTNAIRFWITKKKINLFKCDKCKLGFRHPMPTIADLKELYSEALFAAPGRKEYYIDDESTAHANARDALRLIQRYLKQFKEKESKQGSQPTVRLFDAGCGFGHFLKVARDEGGFDVSGCELSQFAVDHAIKRYNLKITQSALDSDSLSGLYDVITLWDVIEHLQEPKTILQHIAQNLTSDGLLAISTGDHQSFLARLMGRQWSILNPEQHLYYFCLESLDYILNLAGLKRIGVHRMRRLFNARYVAMKVKENVKLLAPVGALTHAVLPKNLRIPLNLGDIMVVLATPKD